MAENRATRNKGGTERASSVRETKAANWRVPGSKVVLYCWIKRGTDLSSDRSRNKNRAPEKASGTGEKTREEKVNGTLKIKRGA